MSDLLVVGLGNPGAEYAGTRHNVGFDVVDLLASRHGGKLRRARRERSLTDEVVIGGRRVALAEPQTYMNDSGIAVAPLVRRYDIDDLERLVVVHDELDLPVGRLKVKLGGGLAGHNGLRSIKSHLHDDGFARVRIGIGKPRTKEQGADHVLRRPGRAVRETLADMVERAADAVESILDDGIEAAMNRFNALPDVSDEAPAGG
jgi:peptidyl-tRNA hydrolase, PTH1 family